MEQIAVGVCVAQSESGYYVMLGFHAMGLAMVVGILIMLDLWVLGPRDQGRGNGWADPVCLVWADH